MTTPTTGAQTSLMLDDQERTYLKGLLEIDLSETRVEVRRADEPDFHAALREREEMIRGLLAKFSGDQASRGAGSSA